MRAGPPLLFWAATAAAAAAYAGCSYDWSAGAARDGGGDDGTIDSSREQEAGAPDATPEHAADGPDEEASRDAPLADVSGPDCAALTAQVQTTRAAAVACQSNASACMTTVTDECSCAVVVYLPTSSATQDYSTAVAALRSSGCKLSCPGCLTPSPGLCILAEAGGGALACYQ